ncbi:hypothetical protein SS50377_27678 [Spironucleus salmonicida]|uniref:Uncharacterized protein n=1 Tax=Spironucleus salmonicida TaxID=348837 RepID=V6LS76_9EUKA|nr:hypothetical protein SS50377_27678 [Spironucleus salmonicida]|eukprot:EST46546.1 Hypothetical protein SS50377_13350 [Spironucleus salmonicida]
MIRFIFSTFRQCCKRVQKYFKHDQVKYNGNFPDIKIHRKKPQQKYFQPEPVSINPEYIDPYFLLDVLKLSAPLHQEYFTTQYPKQRVLLSKKLDNRYNKHMIKDHRKIITSGSEASCENSTDKEIALQRHQHTGFVNSSKQQKKLVYTPVYQFAQPHYFQFLETDDGSTDLIEVQEEYYIIEQE